MAERRIQTIVPIEYPTVWMDIEDAKVCVVLVGLLDESGGVGVLGSKVGGRVTLVTGGAFLILGRPGRGRTITTHS